MTCHLIPDGTICTGGPLYEYQGWRFELHRWCGPVPINKRTGAERKATPQFWKVYEAWCELSETEQRKTRV